MREAGQKEVNSPTDDPTLMELIINYIYTRNIKLDMDNVWQVLPLADLLIITDLKEMCSQFLVSQITPTNVIIIKRFADQFACTNLYMKAKRFILNHFSYVASRCCDFKDIPAEEMLEYLSDDTLNVKREELAYEALMLWVTYDLASREQYLPRFLKTVHLGLIQPEYFLECISTDPVIKHCHGCNDIIEKAWEYLYNLEKYGNKNMDFSNPLVRPRIPRDVVFTIGGWSGGSPISFFETYDARCDRWYTHSLLEDIAPRAYHGLVAINNKIYVLGGFDGAQYFNSVRCFDPSVKEWQEVAPMYNQRCYVCTAVLDGHIYACGGYDGRWRMKSVERYNPLSNQWTKMADMKQRRSDAGADVLNGMYVLTAYVISIN